jgi:hypothetical protein
MKEEKRRKRKVAMRLETEHLKSTVRIPELLKTSKLKTQNSKTLKDI